MIDKLTDEMLIELSNTSGLNIEQIKQLYENSLITTQTAFKYLVKYEYDKRKNILIRNGQEINGNKKLINIVYDLAIKWDTTDDNIKYIIYKL